MSDTLSKRDYYIDFIRIIGCVMIVTMHSPLPSDNAPGPFLTAISYLSAPSIGLFFMASGALLLPVKTDYVTFIKDRLSKILLPTILWSLVYICISACMFGAHDDILQLLLSLPFTAVGCGVLWFAYTLIGLYLLAPILSAWIEKASVRDIEIVLILWGVSLCFPFFENWLMVDKSTSGILYYFSGYAGYFLLGYYLKHYSNRLPFYIPFSISLAGIILALILKIKGIEFDFYRLFWYESIFIAALACCVWMIIHAVGKKLENFMAKSQLVREFLAHLSKMSFGIFFMQILVMRLFLWDIEWIKRMDNYIIQTFVIAFLTYAISAIVSHIISRMPVLRLLVGSKITGTKLKIKKEEELSREAR